MQVYSTKLYRFNISLNYYGMVNRSQDYRLVHIKQITILISSQRKGLDSQLRHMSRKSTIIHCGLWVTKPKDFFDSFQLKVSVINSLKIF